ncbi:hypothetical protein DM02DRAFT_610504 [Periconia macrospinosa]|uniref:Uncharacterized protein n=1 Tax=Periconia macrospinosa TaxID=97972 RepID=A0A2V1E849_9PLEO|nr:hypothetical protein DM02DRAFT_610504 [Periconia macrospinosa]
MSVWLELYQRPAAGSNIVPRTLSLCKFGASLVGFPTICHGGTIMTMMDEALGFAMIANDAAAAGLEIDEYNHMKGETQRKANEQGLPL